MVARGHDRPPDVDPARAGGAGACGAHGAGAATRGGRQVPALGGGRAARFAGATRGTWIPANYGRLDGEISLVPVVAAASTSLTLPASAPTSAVPGPTPFPVVTGAAGPVRGKLTVTVNSTYVRASPDWGGTRIASSLEAFNHRWARRVLGANAAVLLVTDGLDRDDGGQLVTAAAQLHRLAHEVVWLNPLLRFEGFQPRAAGVRALLPHVDRFLPVHNLASLADLGQALRRPALPPVSLLH